MWKYDPYFTKKEMTCKCGCGMLPSVDFMDWLLGLRLRWAQPMIVISGARCPKHNNKVSKSGRNGPHTIGAVDTLTYGEKLFYLTELAMELGATGIGWRQALGSQHNRRVLHLDTIEPGKYPHIHRPYAWSYN